MEVSFTGKDATFWAGYYGPQVRTPNVSLRYTVDPCVSNPGFSPSCPGYNAVTSGNLFTGTTGPQAYAINQALSFAGAGALIHGFNYGYDYGLISLNWLSISEMKEFISSTDESYFNIYCKIF